MSKRKCFHPVTLHQCFCMQFIMGIVYQLKEGRINLGLWTMSQNDIFQQVINFGLAKLALDTCEHTCDGNIWVFGFRICNE
jgi:hypothetical protein